MQEPWIAFEGLGLVFENVQRGITIGENFTIYWYGVLIALGFLLAVILALRSCERFGISQDDLLTYIIVAMPAAIVGARLYFVAFKWEEYADNLWSIFDIRNGGLAIYGGVIAAILAVAIATKVKKQSFWNLLDFAMPYVLIGQGIGRWGNFINQEAYGKETTLPWGMSGSGIEGTVHPNFFYESMWCLLLFVFIMIYRKKLWKNTGELMCLYFAGYGIERTFMEYIRGNDALLIGNQRVSFWVSIALVVVFGAIFVYLRFLKKGPGVKVADEAAKVLAEKLAQEAAAPKKSKWFGKKAAAEEEESVAEEVTEEVAEESVEESVEEEDTSDAE